jgi:hypothetical protein
MAMQAGRDEYEGTSRGAHKPRARHRVPVALLIVSTFGGLPLYGCTEAPPDRHLASTLAPDTAQDMASNTLQAFAPVPAHASKTVPKRSAHVRTERITEKKVAVLDPVTLVGMAPPAIGNILGKPAGTREVALTTEWTYANPSCSLVVFFYPDISTGALHALKFSATGADGAEDGASCIHHILLARSDDHD